MGRKGQPINADVPAKAGNEPERKPETAPAEPKTVERKVADKAATAPESKLPAKPTATPEPKTVETPKVAPVAPEPKPTKPKRKRRPIPTALKGIAALVVIAVVFFVAAIVGGGSANKGTIPSAAPTADGGNRETAEPLPPSQTPSELGYPEFATNNTTRVGGADPASNAAAIALAVYPSHEDELRPGAVVLADAADWRTAIAASVFMAEPVGAPTLLSESDGLPEATTIALNDLAPTGAGSTDGTQILATGEATVPGYLKSTRAEGEGAGGAAAIAKLRDEIFGEPPKHIVVAPIDAPEFAMPAAGWAARSGDPVLFTGRDKLPKGTERTLKRHPKVPVFVLGPPSVISSKAIRQIGKISKSVNRVSGEDPVANAIALARYSNGSFGWNINDPGHGFVVANSDSTLDAVAASPLSGSGTWGPLLLTDSAGTLPKALREYLLDVKPGYTTDPTRAFYNHVWIIGDQDAIEIGQQAEIDELAALAKIGG